MKETKHINLAGYAFIIDEDAAEQLALYLSGIERLLSASDSKEEIMLDIETRIAELFKQHLSYSHTEVVSMLVTQDIMQQLGSPEMITDASAETDSNTSCASGESQISEPNEYNEKNGNEEKIGGKRRLYRSMDDQRVAGVCGGLAAYLQIESIWLRLLLALSICFYGCGLFLYLLLWIIIPAANTTARKLEQQGITPSAENIRQEVERQKEEQLQHPNAPQKTDNKAARGCLITLAILLLSPLLLVLLGAFGTILATLFGVGIFAGPIVSLLGISSGSLISGIVLTLCGMMIFVIPIAVILIWSHHNNRSDKPLSKWFWIIALLLWLAAIAGANIGGFHTYKTAEEWDSSVLDEHLHTWQNYVDSINCTDPLDEEE